VVGRLAIVISVVISFALGAEARAEDGRWVRAESQHFIAYSDYSEAKVRAAVEQLERFDALLRIITGRKSDANAPAPKLEVYLFRNPGSLAEVRPGISSSIRGFYTARPELIAAFAIFSSDYGLEAQDVMFHEYAHHFMMQNSSITYPSWYVEGFAEYVATADIKPEKISWGNIAQVRVNALIEGDWPPMEHILRGDRMRGADAYTFYSLAWFMTHYFYDKHSEQLHAYLIRLNEGADPIAEFPRSFGMSLDDFKKDLRRSTQQGVKVNTAKLRPQDAPSIAVSRMPPSADELLTLAARIRLDGYGAPDEKTNADATTGRERLLDRVRREAAKFPRDAYAQKTLALAEIMLGSPAAGRAAMEGLLASDGDNPEALYLMGLSHVVEARAAKEKAPRLEQYRAARPYFVRAFNHNPDHAPTLFHYTETFVAESGKLTPEQLDVLLTAYALAPQVQEIGLNTAEQLLAAHRYRDAVAVLKPIAFDPHSAVAINANSKGDSENPTVTFARNLLAEAEAKATPDTGAAAASGAPKP
jgi:hypothetical protein